MKVEKRDGRIVDFNSNKILCALKRCFDEVGQDSESIIEELSSKISNEILKSTKDISTVEEIQDIVENNLIEHNLKKEAKSYILYRNKRTQQRNLKNNLTKVLDEVINVKATHNDLKRENANINADTSMGTMLKIGSEASKDYSLTHLIKPKFAKEHVNGDIHIHDLDFYPITMNCMQIPLGKLLKNGFNTGHGNIRQPNSITSASALACIILQANQNEMYGGQSFPCWEYDLSLYVAKSLINHLIEYLEETYPRDNFRELLSQKYINGLFEQHKTLMCDEVKTSIFNKIKNIIAKRELDDIVFAHCVYKKFFDLAIKKTDKETHNAMQAVIHNLNTMQSRAGAQVPFSSLNYGTGTTWEERLIIRSILEETDKGLGHGETPIFPVQIFKLKDGINTKKGDPNFDLFELACKVSAKRLFPNFTFIDSPYNLQYYKDGKPESEVAIMGCRTRVAGNVDKDNEVFPGRGNIFFTTINLPRLGIAANKNIDKFFELFDEKITDCFEQLQDRFDFISKKHVYNYPFLMGEHVYLGSENLEWEDEIGEVLKHGSMSVGFIGLAECLVSLTGHHHGEDENSRELGIKIVKHLRERCDNYSIQTNMNWSCFATPAEGLSGRFVKIDKQIYGEIKGVTDRPYYTNSFHVPVYYDISMFDKIRIEAPYHDLCNAGAISYVEVDGDLTKNTAAFEQIVLFAKENNLGYFSINHPVDRCPVCGFTGVIHDECPKCGFTEKDGVSEEKLKELHLI